jgi:hypothetical protein
MILVFFNRYGVKIPRKLLIYIVDGIALLQRGPQRKGNYSKDM